MPSTITMKCLVPANHPDKVRVQILKNGSPQASKRMTPESAVKLANELLTLALPLLGGLSETPGAQAAVDSADEFESDDE